MFYYLRIAGHICILYAYNNYVTHQLALSRVDADVATFHVPVM